MAGPIPRRLLPDSSTISENGHLLIAGVDTLELADTYGTPLFVYDEQHLRARCREAVGRVSPAACLLRHEGLPVPAMARLAHEEGLQLDVATGGEMAVALRAGVPADRPRAARQQQDRPTSSGRRCRPVWAESSSTASTSSTVSTA